MPAAEPHTATVRLFILKRKIVRIKWYAEENMMIKYKNWHEILDQSEKLTLQVSHLIPL